MSRLKGGACIEGEGGKSAHGCRRDVLELWRRLIIQNIQLYLPENAHRAAVACTDTATRQTLGHGRYKPGSVWEDVAESQTRNRPWGSRSLEKNLARCTRALFDDPTKGRETLPAGEIDLRSAKNRL